MNEEIQRWLEWAYRQGLKARNAEIRAVYAVELVVRGRPLTRIERRLLRGFERKGWLGRLAAMMF
jgi:hypothetical protein